MQDKIQEIMGLVDDFGLKVDAYSHKEVTAVELISARRLIQSKLRELVREPLSEKEKRRIINNWFAEKWAQQQAVGVLHDYELAIKRKSNITNTSGVE